MYESMFYLLNLTALTYSQARAKKNYEEILSMVRPNGNCDVNDRRVTEAVIYAYKTLGVTEKRLYYMWNGKPSENEDYDEDEACQLAQRLHIMVSQFKQSRRHVRSEETNVGTCPVRDPLEVENVLQVFLRECEREITEIDQQVAARPE